MNLRCALIYGADTWKQVLLQCGIPSIEEHRSSLEPSRASILVADGRLSKDDGDLVRAFLAQGGGVIGAAEDLCPALGMGVRRAFIRYVVDERENAWCDLLDLGTTCSIPQEANMLRTNDGSAALFAGPFGGGWLVLLPFDLQTEWERVSTRDRQFPARFDRLPFERVSTVARGDLTYLIGKSLEFLHHQRGLPHPRLWPFPDGAPSMISVRLDTDKSSRSELEAFAKCSQDSGAPFTWFVDTGSHEGFLGVFSEFRDQEIGIHCHRHVIYESVDDYRTDIRLARTLLLKHGIHPMAYAAPFGAWSFELGEAIDDSHLLFSSEFSLGYDSFPFSFRTGTKRFVTPQVPVHPVSTGALRRAGYPKSRMIQYYLSVIRRAMARSEPCFLLDHPVHKNQEVVQEVVREAILRGAVPTRLGDYVKWWQMRENVLRQLSFTWEEQALEAQVNSKSVGDPSIMFEMTSPTGEALLPLGGRYTVSDLKKGRAPYSPAIEDNRRSREFDLRTAFGVTTTSLLRRVQA